MRSLSKRVEQGNAHKELSISHADTSSVLRQYYHTTIE